MRHQPAEAYIDLSLLPHDPKLSILKNTTKSCGMIPLLTALRSSGQLLAIKLEVRSPVLVAVDRIPDAWIWRSHYGTLHHEPRPNLGCG
jgi:hypothetical protein